MNLTNQRTGSRQELRVAGLFAGIGGIELGLHRAGHTTVLLCESEPGASRVLAERFLLEVAPDVRTLDSLGDVDLVTAGFPCQDLSQAGRTAGIRGNNSGLVDHVFRLLDQRKRGPRWLLLENVSFMLHLDRGRGMRHLVDELEKRRFRWAYRVVDTRAFGLPQRRHRVILLASRSEDPRGIIFGQDASPTEPAFSPELWCGFYWTEGLRGLGWAVDAVPTLKGGSTIGIPSPPAIWDPESGVISTPEIRDAERLQGFDPDWTLPALQVPGVRPGHRWKLVGNAVSVPVAKWVGERLAYPEPFDPDRTLEELTPGVAWPKAAWGGKGRVFSVSVSTWPVRLRTPHLSRFTKFPLSPLSHRAASGFKSRMDVSGLNFEDAFRRAIARYVKRGLRAAVA